MYQKELGRPGPSDRQVLHARPAKHASGPGLSRDSPVRALARVWAHVMVETQLHAAILRQDWARSMELALAEPHSVRERDSRGGLPLHCACICGAPLPLMRRLVEAYPEGLEAADKWERTPLEVAVRNGKASGGTLQYLRSNPAPFLFATSPHE